MKKISFFVALLVAMLTFVSCEQRSLKDLIVYEEENNGGGGDNTTPTTGQAGSQENPYSISKAIDKQGEADKWVEGYIVGVYNFDATDNQFVFDPSGFAEVKSNILLGDAAGVPDKYIAVQLLTNDLRGLLNLIDNPNNLGKKVKVYGSLEKYCGISGMKGTVKAEIDGQLIDCEVKAGEATPVTIAEFNSKPVDANVWYELTGVITGTINADYGNFDLMDETGTVYVYGLTATPQSVNDKSYKSLGLEAGDKIKIHGTRGDYNGKIEVLNAYFVELVQKQAGEPEVNMGDPESATSATIEEFLSKPVEKTVWYELIGTVKEFAVKDGTTDNAMIYGNFTLEDATGTVYVYGLTKEPVTKNDQSFASLGVEVGDRIKIRGVRAEYNGEAQVGNAYLIEELEPEKPQMEGAEGEGTEASPYNVPAAYNNQGAEEAVWVEGYIVGFINRRDSDKPTFTAEGCKEKTNVLIAKEANDTLVYVPIELPSGAIRDALNLQANPTNLGKKVKVNGMLQEFFFMPGVKGITKAYLEETLISAE